MDLKRIIKDLDKKTCSNAEYHIKGMIKMAWLGIAAIVLFVAIVGLLERLF